MQRIECKDEIERIIDEGGVHPVAGNRMAFHGMPLHEIPEPLKIADADVQIAYQRTLFCRSDEIQDLPSAACPDEKHPFVLQRSKVGQHISEEAGDPRTKEGRGIACQSRFLGGRYRPLPHRLIDIPSPHAQSPAP